MGLPIADWEGMIEGLSQEGLGVGTTAERVDGQLVKRPVFIPFTAPGDMVRASIVEQKRKYSFGTLKEILKPSTHRVTPPCPHFSVCGGCNLEHVSYDEQLRQKALQVQFLLTRKGVALPHGIVLLPAKQRYNYRRRAKIAVQFTGSKVLAGFRKFHSHEVVPVSSCLIVATEIVALITLLGKQESRVGARGSFVQELIAVVSEGGKVSMLLALDDTPEDERRHVRSFFEELYARNRKLLGNLFFEEGRSTHTSGQVQEHITYKAAGLVFSYLPETFIQSNVATNETLVERALSFLGDLAGKTVIDVYAGLGNLSLPVAKTAKAVVAVEGHEASVLLGRINCLQNNVQNVLFLHRSAEKYASDLARAARTGAHSDEYPAPDVIILDPPRTGCTAPVLRGLLAARPASVLYISCNPVTLANDLKTLEAGYEVKDIVGVDMFPDISHIETVAVLAARER